MAADIVNFRRHRKERTRAEKETRAQENRVRFGRTKREKTIARSQAAQQEKELSGKRLDHEDSDDDPSFRRS